MADNTQPTDTNVVEPVDSSTAKNSNYERTESWWHPGSIGDVSQGLINDIFKVMPYKNKNLSWEDA